MKKLAMSKSIYYRLCDYNSLEDQKSIKQLYKKIFNYDLDDSFELLYGENPFGAPIGILAIDSENGNAVGHFGTMRMNASIDTEVVLGRLSMGFMVDAKYQGNGIASRLSEKLFSRLQELDEDLFVIGFPNDTSYKMHVEKMGYILLRDYKFVNIPKLNIKRNLHFTKLEEIEIDLDELSLGNNILHTSKYFDWRYANSKYDIYISSNGNIFVCTRFNKKIDVLLWDKDVLQSEFVEFANFLYREYDVNLICSWNTFEWLDEYYVQGRKFHFCIHSLTADKLMRKKILNPEMWTFFMGDCELF